MSNTNLDVESVTSISKQEYARYLDAFYKELPFDKALGQINPYTHTVITNWNDYFVYAHCYILKEKAETSLAVLENQYANQNKELSKNLSAAQRESSYLRSSRKFRSILLLLSILLCAVLFFVSSNRPEQSEYNALLAQNEILKEEVSSYKKDLIDAKEAISSSYHDGYSSGYSEGRTDAQASSNSISNNPSSYSSTYQSDSPVSDTDYIGNSSTKKFHRSTCSYLPSKSNQVPLKSRDEAINNGYVPCKRCNP